MIPQYPKFKKLELKDLGLIAERLKKAQVEICELSLTNMFIWKDFDRTQLTEINGNLCILLDSYIEPCFFLEPIGDHKIAETIKVCLSHCCRLSRVSEQFAAKLSHDKYHFKCQRSQFDYIYLRQALAEFRGKKYDGKRNHIKRFKRHFPDYQYVKLEAQHKKQAQALFEDWFAVRSDSRHFSKLAYSSQKRAVEQAFSYFDELGLEGGAIFAEGSMQGFILGSKLNPEMISLHFLYGNPKVQGVSQLLLQESCSQTFSAYKYVNQEQDLGIPGLRKAKLSYQPHKLVKKFEIKSC